ncbi:tetratricopeptide repeat protein [Planctomycetota bacterium]
MQNAIRGVDVCQQRCRALWEKRDFVNAVAQYKKGLWEYPDSISLQLGLAYSYFYLKEYANASRSFEIVLRFQPKNKHALRGLGLCCLKLNRLEDAHRTLNRLQLDGDLQAAELMEIAYFFFQVQDYAEALRFADMVIEQAPNYCDAFICAGGCLHFQERVSARKYSLFYRALDLEPERVDLLDFFGNVLFDDTHIKEALAIFERIPVDELKNQITLKRMIQLYEYFGVDESITGRYRERLDTMERNAGIDGLVSSIMNYLDKE